MWWPTSRKRNKVLVVGYSPRIVGGVTTVTRLLLENIPCLQLHVALHCYRPRWKMAAAALYGLLRFMLRLLFAAPQVVQVVVGSRGDALRTLPYIAVGKLRGCKVCLHFHKNLEAILCGLPAVVRHLVLAFWRLADRGCFLSKRLRAEFVDQLRPRMPCVVIPNPISADWLRQETIPRAERTRDLVFLGRWSWEKGNNELLSVMRSLGDAPPFRCDIYADISHKEPEGNCFFHQWADEDEVRRVLRESRILLLPSRAEAFPTVLIEAAACGTPFVASNIAGIPDIAEESHVGLLHDVGDAEGMKRAILRLLADDALWNGCSYNGKRWAASLAVAEIVPQWLRLYEELGVTNG